VDVPGFKKDEISLSIIDNTLTISVSRASKDSKDTTSTNTHTDTTSDSDAKKGVKPEASVGRKAPLYRRTERFFGKTSRSFLLPDDAMTDHKAIKAELSDGVLKITVPKEPLKVEAKLPKSINIEAK